MSTRVTENIVCEVEMFEIIYVTKEDMKSEHRAQILIG